MGLRISPASGFKLVIIREGFSHFVGLVVFVIPGVFKNPVWNTDPSRVTLTADLQTSFVRQFSGMDDLSFGPGRFDVLGAWAMASFASIIELDVF